MHAYIVSMEIMSKFLCCHYLGEDIFFQRGISGFGGLQNIIDVINRAKNFVTVGVENSAINRRRNVDVQV